MTDYVFQSEFRNVEIGEACKALSHRRRGQGGFWTGPFGFITAFVILGGLGGTVSGFIDGEKGIFLGLLAAALGATIFWVTMSKKAQTNLYEAPIRVGPVKISLSPEGYHVTHPGFESLTRWSHLPGVISTPQGLLILHSDYEYYPIEMNAFRDEEEMEAVADQIRSWIASAQT